jgi:hypothetical protein
LGQQLRHDAAVRAGDQQRAWALSCSESPKKGRSLGESVALKLQETIDDVLHGEPPYRLIQQLLD